MTTNYQFSTLRLVHHPHPSYPSGLKRKNVEPVGVDVQDVIQATLHKDLGQAAGGVSLTLVPRQKYLQRINPNDWFEVFLDADKPSTYPEMIVSVDSIRRNESTDEKGATHETITVECRDYGKVFLSVMLIIDPLIGAILDQTTFEQEVIISKFAGNAVPFRKPDEVIQALVERYHDKRIQCTLPESLGQGPQGSLNLEFGEGIQGRIVVNGNPNLQGNLWSTMEQYLNPMLNEMWVDTLKGKPTLIVEERPYSHEAFANLEGVEYLHTDSTQTSFGKSDSDTKNWFRIYADAQFIPTELVNVANLGYFSPASLARSGLRKMESSTNAFGDGFSEGLIDSRNGIASGILQKWAGLIAEWNATNDFLLSGTVSGRFIKEAKIGRRLDYTNSRKNEKLSFYIEGVTHSYSYPGTARTSLNLTRGVERGEGLSFPLLKSLEDLRLNDVLSLMEKTGFDSVKKAAQNAVNNPPAGQALV